jgi:predicted DNA-binding protein (UPF0251 family)
VNKRKTLLPDIRKPHERLAFSEFWACKLIATRVPRQQAYEKLSIHRTTFKRTLDRALRKMDLKNDNDLYAYNAKHGVF